VIKNVLGAALCLGLVGSTVACGGSEKAPESTSSGAQDAGALRDFGRDIEQMAAGVSDAPANFADDLLDLVWPRPARARVEALAQELSKALKGKTITESQRDALARGFVAAASGTDASGAGSEVGSQLTAAGVSADAVSAVTNAMVQLAARE